MVTGKEVASTELEMLCILVMRQLYKEDHINKSNIDGDSMKFFLVSYAEIS